MMPLAALSAQMVRVTTVVVVNNVSLLLNHTLPLGKSSMLLALTSETATKWDGMMKCFSDPWISLITVCIQALVWKVSAQLNKKSLALMKTTKMMLGGY
jgi:hypothetical protein